MKYSFERKQIHTRSQIFKSLTNVDFKLYNNLLNRSSSIRYYISHDSFNKDLVILVNNDFMFALLKFFTSHAIIQMLTAYWTANARLPYKSGQKQVTRNQTTGTCTYTTETKRVLIIFPLLYMYYLSL